MLLQQKRCEALNRARQQGFIQRKRMKIDQIKIDSKACDDKRV